MRNKSFFASQGITFDCPHCRNRYDKKRDLMTHLEEVHQMEINLHAP
jgi:hypothetical protein